MSDTPLTRTIASTATLKIASIHSLDLFYTPIEERFERLTRLGRRALHVPVAAISLLNEDKQWFKSAAGWGISELPREQAICKQTVEANQPLVIGDTLQYRSTAQTPWATPLIWPQSLWYAGLVLFMLVAVGFAIRASRLLFEGRIDELTHEFHPKSAKEELKEELADFAQRRKGRA